MNKRNHHRRKLWLLTAGWLTVAVQVCGQGVVSAATARSPEVNATYVPKLTFDVASIRQSAPADSYMVSGSFSPNSSTLRVTNNRLENLLLMAYGGDAYYRISGIPDSFQQAMFNIQAKSDSAADEKLTRLNKEQAALEQRHMLQVLLAERFKLKVHWETKEGSVYNLVSKNGSKLRETKGEPPTADELKYFGDEPVPALYQQGDSLVGFDFIGRGCSIEMIVNMLAGQFDRPIVNKTGLKGKYDFTLRYYGTSAIDRDDDDTNPLSPLEKAIQDQLGLKLEPAKGPVPILVVDHVEKPSEN
jgi:uncharacterized protein (TIGR03435 family)